MFATLAMSVMLNNAVVPVMPIEDVTFSAFDKTSIIIALNEQVKSQVESISTEAIEAVNLPSIVLNEKVEAELENNNAETLSDEQYL